MWILSEMFSNFSRKNTSSDKSNYIFYKIVDFLNIKNEYTLQCINTNGIFRSTIEEIIFDSEILYGLHPLQSCFIGLECAKYSRTLEQKKIIPLNEKENFALSRYGIYELLYQTRKGELCFRNQITDEEYLMDPRDIALSQDLIQEFDSSQAFYIGLYSGIKLENPIKEKQKITKPKLTLVK